MKQINYKNLIYNNYYYICYNNCKYHGIFLKLHDYDYFYIAEFKNVMQINSHENSNTTNFIINNYYYNLLNFYIPELEILLFEQVLRQKIKDEIFAKTVSKII